MTGTKLGIILVTYGNGREILPLLNAIEKEKKRGDKVVLIDNHPEHATADFVNKNPVVDIVIRSENVGFAVGCNTAAEKIQNEVDLLMFLNPDSRPIVGAINKLRHGGQPDWGAWMGLLVLSDGKKVNSAGNVVHISGLSWVSGFGKPTSVFTQGREVIVASGADLVVRSSVWKKINGFPPIYFIYYEDTELSIDLQMIGYKVGLVPEAHVQHDYDFYNSPLKWLYIERNRYIFILRTWPLGVIVILAPLLFFVEIGLWVVSLMQRRFRLKLRSTAMVLMTLPQVLRERRRVQRHNKLSSYEFLCLLQPRIDTPLLPSLLHSWPVNAIFVSYYRLAKFMLRFFR